MAWRCFGASVRATTLQHLLFAIDIRFDGAPFRCNLAGDRLGFHAERKPCLLIAIERSALPLGRRRTADERGRFEIVAVGWSELA